MKAIFSLIAVLVATGAAFAQAQIVRTSISPTGKTNTRVILSPAFQTGAGYGGYPAGYSYSSTPAEGLFRGVGDVIRSEGDYNLSTSEAAVNLSQARQQEIENQKQWTQTYFDIRNINRQVFESEQKRRRGSPEDWVRLAQAGKPTRLGPGELDAVTGEIHWPILLTSGEYSGARVELEKAFADRAYHGILGADIFLKVLQLTEYMVDDLKTQIRGLPTEQYVVAKHFLESLAFEAGQPAG